MHQPRRTRRLLVAAPTLLLALSLVGCGDLFEDAVKDKVEDAAKSEGVDLDLDDLEEGEINIDSTDGGASTGKLPRDFPTDEVPVVDGEILGGTYTKNPPTWNATIEVGPPGGDKAAAYDEAEALLVNAGLDTVTEAIDNGTAINGQYATDTYLINLSVTDSNGIVVNYLVSPK
jgi:hypothetical protein